MLNALLRFYEIELKNLKNRLYYEMRGGCKILFVCREEVGA